MWETSAPRTLCPPPAGFLTPAGSFLAGGMGWGGEGRGSEEESPRRRAPWPQAFLTPHPPPSRPTPSLPPHLLPPPLKFALQTCRTPFCAGAKKTRGGREQVKENKRHKQTSASRGESPAEECGFQIKTVCRPAQPGRIENYNSPAFHCWLSPTLRSAISSHRPLPLASFSPQIGLGQEGGSKDKVRLWALEEVVCFACFLQNCTLGLPLASR